jgi:hypothetical protein
MKILSNISLICLLLTAASCKKEIATITEPSWLKQDLLVYYPLNGNVKDSSGNGYDGIINGTIQPTSNRKGIQSKAYYFDTGEMISNINSQYFNKDFSISLWSQLEEFTSEYPTIMYGEPFLAFQYVKGPPNKASFYLFSPLGSIVSASYSTPINYTNWSHIVIVNKDGFTTFYLDGNKLGSSENSRNQAGVGNGAFIKFGNVIRNQLHFKGKLDEIRIYQRALNKEEVVYLFEN